MIDTSVIRERFAAVERDLNERSRRLLVAAEAKTAGYGGIAAQAAGQPVISIDTKKKEPIGSYKNGGSDYRRQGCPDEVNVHDLLIRSLGKSPLMDFTTSPPIRLASILASATTRHSSRSIRSDAG